MFSSLFRADGADDRSVFGDFWFEPVSARSASGMRVSPDQALRLSTVYRCVRVRAGTMASLPLCFYRPDGRGRKRVTDHWLYKLLSKKPNRWQNGFEWHQMMEAHLSLRGTAYNRIVSNGRGEIEALVPMHPDRMTVEVLDDAGKFRYRYKSANGSDEVLAPGNVFKIAGLSMNGFTGLNPMQLATDSVGEGLAQQAYSSRFFANDARPTGGWIEYPSNFKDKDARQAFRESWQQAQAGANRGKTAVLEGGMKFHELGVSNKDAQFLEAKNAKVPDICRWFGVPPHLAFALDRATDNNIEHLSLEFIKYTMREEAECFEAAIEDQLLSPDEGIEIEYDMDRLARGDMKSRAEYYQLGINGGWLVRNEARAMEGMNPLDELDEPLQPLNMVPAGTEPEPEPKPRTPAEDPPADEVDARVRRLELAIAGRAVRKEVAAVAKAWERGGWDEAGWNAWLEAFYTKHEGYLVESQLCTPETARAWCASRRAGLKFEREIKTAAEAELVTELAALVQTSGLKP